MRSRNEAAALEFERFGRRQHFRLELLNVFLGDVFRFIAAAHGEGSPRHVAEASDSMPDLMLLRIVSGVMSCSRL